MIPNHIDNDQFWQSIEKPSGVSKLQQLATEIDQYLELGGLFNPELMNHVAVRDLLIDIRAAIRS